MQSIMGNSSLATHTSVRLRQDEPRYLILKKLSQCRGYRAYAPSLFGCFDSVAIVNERHVHNTCASLFRYRLLEKVRGMYQLTADGLEFLGMQ